MQNVCNAPWSDIGMKFHQKSAKKSRFIILMFEICRVLLRASLLLGGFPSFHVYLTINSYRKSQKYSFAFELWVAWFITEPSQQIADSLNESQYSNSCADIRCLQATLYTTRRKLRERERKKTLVFDGTLVRNTRTFSKSFPSNFNLYCGSDTDKACCETPASLCKFVPQPKPC